MKSSQLKHLAFYGGAISLVLGLFTVVTSYGEAHLKTAPGIEGSYVLKLPMSATCGGGTPVMLTLQQSGVYVAAALVNPALPRSQTALKSMTLSGQWRDRQLNLTGKVPVGVLCGNPKDKAAIAVKIEGVIAPQQKSSKPSPLTGTLSLNSALSSLMAQRQPVLKEESK